MINVRKNCLVFRVEDIRGLGPYRYNDFPYLHYHGCSNAHPGPKTEGFRDYFNKSMFFCFTGKYQLKRWFSSFIRVKLDCDGFVCNVYYTNKCYYSKTQAVFNRNDSKLVDSIPLTII